MALSSQFMSGVGTAMKDLLLANVASAIANVDINIFGVDLHPFGFLQTWGTDLTNQANAAIADAATAQTAADTAQTTATTAQSTATTAQATATTATSAAATAQSTANSKPDLVQIPISSPMWLSINPDEISTVPRANLHYGSAGSTSAASGTASHSHGLGQIPQYTPGGNGANFMDIGYIRVPNNRAFSNIGWISGGSVTGLGVSGFYAAVYSVNVTTGDLTLLATSPDLSGSVGSTNTEYKFALGSTITASQGAILAGCILQVTNITQTCNSLLCQTITTLTPPSGQYPQRPYAYAGAYSLPPSSITQGTLNYSASNKVPFIALS